MTGKLYINGKDAWTNYRVFLEDGSIDKLLLPPPLKQYVENKSRSEDGKRVIHANPRVDDRDVTLVFCFATSNPVIFEHQFWGIDNFASRLETFMNAIMGLDEDFEGTAAEIGVGDLNKKFYLTYISSVELSSIKNKIGKIAIRFNESNPTNRTYITTD